MMLEIERRCFISNSSKAAKVSVVLTPEMTQLVQEAVASGEYGSDGEVIREAPSEWKLRRTLKLQKLDELRPLWAEGLASGPGRFESIEAIKQEGAHGIYLICCVSK